MTEEPDRPARTQKTDAGAEIPVPKRREFFDNLKRATAPDRKEDQEGENRSP